MANILVVSTMVSAPWGASEELWGQSVPTLLGMGHHVAVSVQWWSNESGNVRRLEAAGCTVRRRRPDGLRERLLRRLNRDLERSCLESLSPQLTLISQGGMSDGLPWMQACRAHGIPYAVVAHSSGDLFWPRDDETRRQLALHYESAVACYFVSHRSLELARVQMATDLRHGAVVRNPFNVPFENALPWPSTANGYALACVARLDPHSKGQDILFRVMRDPKWRARPLHVDLFGDGRCAETLALLAKRYELRNVSLAGHVDDVVDIWRTHHGLVLPSRYEGMPLSVVEAMLCGRPCFVTDVGGNAELVEDGVSGVIAPFATCDAVDAALERAWAARESWPRMGAEAARRARHLLPSDPAADFAAMISALLKPDAPARKADEHAA